MTPAPPISTASPARPCRAGKAFTMMELMLAMVLGVIVLTTTLGVFAALQRSSRHNEDRLRNAIELASTQRAVEFALRSMILSTSRPPVPASAGPTDRPGQPPVAKPADPAAPADVVEERPRVILSPDTSVPHMFWRDGQGREVELEAQRIEITVERPPVFPEPLPGENFTPVVHRMYASRHQRDREQRRDEREADRQNPEASTDNPYDDTEPAIAAGVRGAFGLTWESDQPRPGETPNPDGGSWTLWWRTLPPIVTIPDAETTEGLSEDELDRNPMYRPVMLASNLRWCKWEAVRGGETLSEFESTWWEDLPAYVTLEIQTVTGKWSKWMFEVQGTRGAEPGTPTGGGPAEQPATPNDAAAQLNEQLGGNAGAALDAAPRGVRPMSGSSSRPSSGGRRNR